jgi:hypothetical protein
MIYLTIKTTILSIIFIFIVHNIIYYFKDNLTIPKTKDLITITEKKYDDIHKTLNILNTYSMNSSTPSASSVYSNINNTTTSIIDLPKPSNNNNTNMYYDNINLGNIDNSEYTSNIMKDELKCFLKQHQM